MNAESGLKIISSTILLSFFSIVVDRNVEPSSEPVRRLEIGFANPKNISTSPDSEIPEIITESTEKLPDWEMKNFSQNPFDGLHFLGRSEFALSRFLLDNHSAPGTRDKNNHYSND